MEKTNTANKILFFQSRKMKKEIIIFFIAITTVSNISAQETNPPAPKNNKIPKQEIKSGNELYKNKQYKEAQESYGAALMKNPNSYHGLYNMGNTLYQLDDVENARKAYQAGANNATSKEEKAKAWHNAGNTYMKEEKWQEAVNAYKESLRNSPNNQDTKYNLAYANAKLKQQQQQNKDDKNKDDKNEDKNKDQQKDQQNKDENKDNKEDQKDKQENKDQQDKQDNKDDKQQENKEGDKEENEERKPQGQPSKLSEKEAENILNALRQEEKKIQEKKNKQKGRPIILDKDW